MSEQTGLGVGAQTTEFGVPVLRMVVAAGAQGPGTLFGLPYILGTAAPPTVIQASPASGWQATVFGSASAIERTTVVATSTGAVASFGDFASAATYAAQSVGGVTTFGSATSRPGVFPSGWLATNFGAARIGVALPAVASVPRTRFGVARARLAGSITYLATGIESTLTVGTPMSPGTAFRARALANRARFGYADVSRSSTC
jgi:hypothetical protein